MLNLKKIFRKEGIEIYPGRGKLDVAAEKIEEEIKSFFVGGNTILDVEFPEEFHANDRILTCRYVTSSFQEQDWNIEVLLLEEGIEGFSTLQVLDLDEVV